MDTESVAVHGVRRLLLVILGLGMAGTATDLLLIEHFEGVWQLPPLLLIGAGLLLVMWLGVRPTQAGRAAILALRVTMVLFILAGGAGVLLHYSGNREFQIEMDPTLAGWTLFVKVMTAKAPPALAPGVMVQLGLLGLVYTYRHPALAAPGRRPVPTSSGA